MTIVEAIVAVMFDADRPLTAMEIHAAILAKNLYAFKAQQPAQIIRQQIRRHCVGIDNAVSSKIKYFAQLGDDRYTALPRPIGDK